MLLIISNECTLKCELCTRIVRAKRRDILWLYFYFIVYYHCKHVLLKYKITPVSCTEHARCCMRFTSTKSLAFALSRLFTWAREHQKQVEGLQLLLCQGMHTHSQSRKRANNFNRAQMICEHGSEPHRACVFCVTIIIVPCFFSTSSQSVISLLFMVFGVCVSDWTSNNDSCIVNHVETRVYLDRFRKYQPLTKIAMRWNPYRVKEIQFEHNIYTKYVIMSFS